MESSVYFTRFDKKQLGNEDKLNCLMLRSYLKDREVPMSRVLPQFPPTARHPKHFAEVIETATTEFLAQYLETEESDFPEMPPFRSWVSAKDEITSNQVLGIVTYGTTKPIDLALHKFIREFILA